MKFEKVLTSVFAWLVIGCQPSAIGQQPSNATRQIAKPFAVREVTLLDGPFRHAQDLDAAYLLTIDLDRLLSWFRKEAKLEPRAKEYGGWESMGVAGHSLGHYLSACSRMVHASGNPEFKRRVDTIVEELAKCQQAGGDGYIGAIPRGREIFAEIARGDIRSQGFDLNGGWVPWYTQHKVLAGLIDAAVYCDNQQALEVAVAFADWIDATTKSLTPEQWQRMLACEHGGMNESLAELSAITGDPKYLALAEKFYHAAILDPLAAGKDELSGKHANTQIPKIIGAARIAELTKQENFAAIARFFWQTVVNNHSYVTGGNSMGEHFGDPRKLNDRLGANTTETCNTYNMLKLTAALFADNPTGAYADFAERALWNHILASQNSQSGMVCYFVPLQAGGKKPFQTAEAFTCCSGSGMENHARYGEYIFARSDDTLWVNQLISSELNWQQRGIKLRLESGLPHSGKVRLSIACERPQELTVKFRHPHWVKEGLKVTVNGEQVDPIDESDSYITLHRTWNDGDVVELLFPLALRLESMPDNPRRVAIFYGPILVAGILDGDADAILPVLVTGEKPVEQWVKQPNIAEPVFETVGVGRPSDLKLVPFYSINDDRYVVYWDLFSESDWEQHRHEYEAERERLRQLEKRTVDFIAIGEMQPERDHKVTGEETSAGEFGGRKYRHAYNGGWFSCEIKLPQGEPTDLVLTYWGSETGNRDFDLLLDGEKFATQSLHRDRPEKFWEKTYPLPENLTANKATAVLRFQAHTANFAGGVYGIRVVRRGE